MLWSLISAPESARRDEEARADFAILTGALRRLLSQWPPHVSRRHFPSATKVHGTLRIRMRLPVPLPVRLSPHLLSDLCHEIAEHVDASVREAAVRCMRRCAASAPDPCR